MIGYAELEIFTKHEQGLLERAVALVEIVPYEWEGDAVRCHELVRAVGFMLGLDYCDGWFGMCEHSWLWTRKPNKVHGFFADGVPNVLDVYATGRLPMVQLVASSPNLPYEYRRGDRRRDVRMRVVTALVEKMRTEA